MGLFHKNKQKEAVQEVKQPQISLEDKAYPIIYTANYISERFENLSDEEVVVSNQIVGIKEAFDNVLTEMHRLSVQIQNFEIHFREYRMHRRISAVCVTALLHL